MVLYGLRSVERSKEMNKEKKYDANCTIYATEKCPNCRNKWDIEKGPVEFLALLNVNKLK